MEKDLLSLDVDSLKNMYLQQSALLATALINGADWDTLNDQRVLVTQLAIAIDRKSTTVADNPAENTLC